jgi:hypothetical protein
MPRRSVVVWGVLLWGVVQPVVSSDVIELTTKRRLQGIILREREDQLEVQVAWKGFTTLERAVVVSIAKESAEDHQRLLSQWEEDYLDGQRRQQQERAFEAEQRARGMVKYRGEWISAESLTSLLTQQASNEQQIMNELREREEESRRMLRRLQDLEQENQRLGRQLTEERRTWISGPLITTPFLVRSDRAFHRRHDRQVVRDEHGNLLRVREHDGHKFFTTPDGTHVDLQLHDGHLAFRDESGIHHDVNRLSH